MKIEVEYLRFVDTCIIIVNHQDTTIETAALERDEIEVYRDMFKAITINLSNILGDDND